MFINADLDKLVYAIIQDCGGVIPPLGRGEIEAIAVEQIELSVREGVRASLSRLVDQGHLAQVDTDTSPRYYLAHKAAA